MAGLLAFAGPVTFLVGAISVMRAPTPGDLVRVMLWWLLYGLALWALLLATGYGDQRLGNGFGRAARGAIWLVFAGATATVVTVSTAGRADVLTEQGVVLSAMTMHLHAGVFSFMMVLLYLAHLQHSHWRTAATARLSRAQAAQREAGADMARSRLAAVQARIDPQLLFGMLEAVRAAYRVDAARAECLLDELIAFLRAALPILGANSSSVPHEAALAQACVRLHVLAGANRASLKLMVSPEAMHARFPPGVLLPLLDDSLRAQAGPCILTATRQADACRLLLQLPRPPSQPVLARVQALLADIHRASAQLTLEPAGGKIDHCVIGVQVPYELA